MHSRHSTRLAVRGHGFRQAGLRFLLCLGGVAAAVGMVAVLFHPPRREPPSVTIELLGYTNRTGPFARLAITNHSAFAITFRRTCLVCYSLANGPRRLVSIDVDTTARLGLLPDEGYVQEVFVFPTDQSVWHFEMAAAYSSRWLDICQCSEDFLRKGLPFVRHPLTSRSYREFTTEWIPDPR